MKKIKSFISGVVNWFKTKHEVSKLLKEKEELNINIDIQREILEALKDITDKYIHLEKLKQTESSLEHQLKLNHKLKSENKELKAKSVELQEKIKELEVQK